MLPLQHPRLPGLEARTSLAPIVLAAVGWLAAQLFGPTSVASAETGIAVLGIAAKIPSSGAAGSGGLPAARILPNGQVLFGLKVAEEIRRLDARDSDVVVYGLSSGAKLELWPALAQTRWVTEPDIRDDG